MLLVGDGDEEPVIRATARRLGLDADGTLIMPGRVDHDEILSYYSVIDVFVVPRTANRVAQLVTPLKPYEAMALERPLVVSDLPALREIVIPGETGLTFEPENPVDLADVLASLLDDPGLRTALGRRAREWIAAERTWARNGQLYRAIFERLGVGVKKSADAGSASSTGGRPPGGGDPVEGAGRVIRTPDESLLVPPGARLLHIGPPKTGTTSLQASFWTARADALAQGVHYAGRSRHSSRAVLAVTNRASFDEDRGTPSMDNWNRLLREIRAAREPRLILSSEGFAYAQSDAIRRIVDDLDPHRVHVVVTLRPLQRILASEWQEHVQSGLRAGFENWLDAMLNKPPGRLTPTFWHRQRHDALIARWAEVVGPASLTAVVVDDRDHAFLLRAFERLLGLRDGTLEVQRDVTNRSLTLGELTAIRALSEQFIAEGLSRAAFHRIVRMKVAAFMKARPPDPGELRIETPQWALDRAGEIEREIVAGIRASGVRVVGDLDALTVVPTSPLAGDRLPEIEVPAAVAGSMAMGALLSGGAVPGAASAESANGDGRPRFNELRVGDVATRRLVAVIATRVRRSNCRGLARLTGRGR